MELIAMTWTTITWCSSPVRHLQKIAGKAEQFHLSLKNKNQTMNSKLFSEPSHLTKSGFSLPIYEAKQAMICLLPLELSKSPAFS